MLLQIFRPQLNPEPQLTVLTFSVKMAQTLSDEASTRLTITNHKSLYLVRNHLLSNMLVTLRTVLSQYGFYVVGLFLTDISPAGRHQSSNADTLVTQCMDEGAHEPVVKILLFRDTDAIRQCKQLVSQETSAMSNSRVGNRTSSALCSTTYAPQNSAEATAEVMHLARLTMKSAKSEIDVKDYQDFVSRVRSLFWAPQEDNLSKAKENGGLAKSKKGTLIDHSICDSQRLENMVVKSHHAVVEKSRRIAFLEVANIVIGPFSQHLLRQQKKQKYIDMNAELYNVVNSLRDQDFEVVGIKTVHLSRAQSMTYLRECTPLSATKHHQDENASYLSSAPVFVLSVERANAVSRLKKLLGLGNVRTKQKSR